MTPVANIPSASATVDLPHGAVHPVPAARLHGIKGRPDMVAIGTLIWLASELMFFAALFAAYFSLRDATNAMAAPGEQTMWEWGASHFLTDPVVGGQQWPWFSMVNTLILVLSSITCQIGVFRAEKGFVGRTGSPFNPARWGMREWYWLTFFMGAVFIGGQAYEYALLMSEGFALSTNAYTGAFFLATGFHGLHVLGGLIAFVVLIGRTYLARTFTHEQRVHAIVTSYYWHFVDIVWIILFSVIYLIR